MNIAFEYDGRELVNSIATIQKNWSEEERERRVEIGKFRRNKFLMMILGDVVTATYP